MIYRPPGTRRALWIPPRVLGVLNSPGSFPEVSNLRFSLSILCGMSISGPANAYARAIRSLAKHASLSSAMVERSAKEGHHISPRWHSSLRRYFQISREPLTRLRHALLVLVNWSQAANSHEFPLAIAGCIPAQSVRHLRSIPDSSQREKGFREVEW